MNVSQSAETQYYNALYAGADKNEWIYKDIRNKRFIRLAKIVIAGIISAIPAIGSILGVVAKLLA